VKAVPRPGRLSTCTVPPLWPTMPWTVVEHREHRGVVVGDDDCDGEQATLVHRIACVDGEAAAEE
jgi:hypothetical protein